MRKGGDNVAAIIEESQLTEEQRELNEINSSMYSFTTAKLWPALAEVKPNNKHREIYLTDAIGVLNTKGETVLQFHGTGPWTIRYVNPADDPRTTAK